MKKIPLTQGKFALVDDEDFKELNKYKGVSLHKTSNLWRSRITLTNIFNRQFIHSLGYFNNEEEAAKVYDKAARQEHGEFGRYNFPRKDEQSALL